MLEQLDDSDINAMLAVNISAPMCLTKLLLPLLKQADSAMVVNVGSTYGSIGYPGYASYCATKFAVEGFSESLALEVARFGIHVTVVEPGFFRTDFLDATSVRYGDTRIADYDDPQGAPRVDYSAYNHRQPGDPAKLGRALVQMAAWDDPPLRFAAGSDAVAFARETFDRRLAEIAEHAALSSSTDFAAG